MLQQRPKPTAGTSQAQAAFESTQRRRQLLALVLLLVAFACVLVRESELWFGSNESQADNLDVTGHGVTHPTVAKSVPNAVNQAPSVPAPTARKQVAASTGSTETKVADSGVVATKRTVLPPLEVEVVAGDTHRTLHPGSNAAEVAIANSRSALAESPAQFGAATNAAERERISTSTVHMAAEGSVEAPYPLLAQQAKVEGSVVLQALIGVDGVIQDLRVLSGPSILASAAQQAVRQWRFKPYVQDGQLVETKARITVNFTIKVADNSSKNS